MKTFLLNSKAKILPATPEIMKNKTMMLKPKNN